MQHFKVPPDKENIIILSVCTTLSCFLLFIGYKGSPPISVHPVFLVLLSVAGLALELRFIYLSQDTITVQYLFHIKRKIAIDRVKSIEFVSQGKTSYLFISLDNCPSFAQSGQSIRNYVFLHPVKLIAFYVPFKKRSAYCDIIVKMYSNVRFIGWDPLRISEDPTS